MEVLYRVKEWKRVIKGMDVPGKRVSKGMEVRE